MDVTHLYALIPLIIFLILSLIFYGRGIVHLITLSYSAILFYGAVVGEWEMLMFPIAGGGVLIGMILFMWSMSAGDWL